MPKIFYSSIVSFIISSLLKKLALTQKDILRLKKIKIKNEMIEKAKNLLKCLKIKISFYFSFVIFISFFFWYYLSCFGAVYRNTQKSLINNSFSSFFLSIGYSFGLSLLPVPFRMSALKSKDRKCIFKFSNYISLI